MFATIVRKLALCALGAALCVGAGSSFAAEPIKIKIAYGNNVGEPNDKAVRE